MHAFFCWTKKTRGVWRASLGAMLSALCALAWAGDAAPWGRAQELAIEYQPRKVVFDVVAGSETELSNILDRISLLNNLYGADPFEARIVMVLHGQAIPLFAIRHVDRHRELMTRAESLTHSGTVEFRLCRAAARARYRLEPRDFHGFVKTVPMADAEIIRLQADEGYAYMR
jgi:uncharacterized protein